MIEKRAAKLKLMRRRLYSSDFPHDTVRSFAHPLSDLVFAQDVLVDLLRHDGWKRRGEDGGGREGQRLKRSDVRGE